MGAQDELLLKLIYQEENKKALTEATAQLEKMTQAEKDLVKQSTALSTSHDKVSQSTNGLNGMLGKANVLIGGALVAGLGAAAAASIKLGMDMEQTKVAFTTLTGSAENAEKHLKDLRDFAASTPFQFTELTAASKQMMAFGFATEKIVPMLRDIGDATSALGMGAEGIDRVTRAMGQMKAKGKVSGEEMRQLAEAGIPAWKYLAEGIGKTTAETMKLSEKGLIPAGEAVDYLLAGMRKDFGGMMAKQSETAAGQLSNLVDSLESVGTSIGTIALPAIKLLIKGLQELAKLGVEATATMNTLTEGPQKIAVAFDTTAKNMRQSVLDGKMSMEDYNNAIKGMVESIYLLPPAGQDAIVAAYQLTAAQIAAMKGAYGLNGALDESSRASRRSAEASKGVASAEGGVERQTQSTLDGLKAYAEATQANSVASKEFAKWLSEGVAEKMKNLSTIMSGALKNENKQYAEQEDTLIEKAAKLRDEIEKLSAANGRSFITTEKASLSENERIATQAKLAVVTEDLTLQTRKKNETDAEFTSRMAGLQVQADNLTGKLGEATVAVMGYVDNSKKIGELKGEYDAINAEIETNAAKHEDATNRIMFGYLQQEIAAKVATGAMTSTEGFDAAMSVATELGIVSAEDATAIGKMGSALDTALFSKDWKGLGGAIREALNPPVIPPAIVESYTNMYDASRKGFVAPVVDTTSIELAQKKFDELSISTAARNFPIDFKPIIQTLGEGITSTQNVQIALDQLTGVPAGERINTPMREVITQVNSAKTSADFLKDAIEQPTGIPARDKIVSPMKEIITQINSAKTSADFLKGSLDEIKSKTITIKVVYEQDGVAPSGSGFASGANFIVPPGYPHDTYPMRVSSGERVIVEPRNVANNSVTNNWNVNADQAGMALLLERQRMMNSLGFEMRM